MMVVHAKPLGQVKPREHLDIRCQLCGAKLLEQHERGGAYSIKCRTCKVVVGWGISTEGGPGLRTDEGRGLVRTTQSDTEGRRASVKTRRA